MKRGSKNILAIGVIVILLCTIGTQAVKLSVKKEVSSKDYLSSLPVEAKKLVEQDKELKQWIEKNIEKGLYWTMSWGAGIHLYFPPLLPSFAPFMPMGFVFVGIYCNHLDPSAGTLIFKGTTLIEEKEGPHTLIYLGLGTGVTGELPRFAGVNILILFSLNKPIIIE